MDYFIYTDTSLPQETIAKMPQMKIYLKGTTALSYNQIEERAKKTKDPNELFLATLCLVARAAKKAMPRAKMVSPTTQFEDIFQAGALGLFQACKNFKRKHKSKAKFTSFAHPHIHGRICSEAIYKERFFHLPEDIEAKLCNPLDPEHERSKDTKDYPKSLETVDTTTIPSPEKQPWEVAAYSMQVERLHNCIARLNPQQKTIIKQYFGIGGNNKTLKQIGSDLGLTKARIRQILKETIKTLKKYYLFTKKEAPELNTIVASSRKLQAQRIIQRAKEKAKALKDREKISKKGTGPTIHIFGSQNGRTNAKK